VEQQNKKSWLHPASLQVTHRRNSAPQERHLVQMALRICAVTALACLATPAHGNAKLSIDMKVLLRGTPASILHSAFDAAASEGSNGSSVQTVNQLRPIFDTLPLNQYGRLDSTGVRYLMYRHFLHQHGWLMQGLVPDGDPWNRPFPVELLGNGTSRRTIESLLAGKGMSLEDTAVLTRALKKQVEADALNRLRLVWQAHGFQPQAHVQIREVDSLLDMHMSTYVLPALWDRLQDGAVDPSIVGFSQKVILDLYPKWPRTQTFLREALQDVKKADFSLDAAGEMVLKVLYRFGLWQDLECDELKHTLLQMEGSRLGRVDLVRFYEEAVSDDSQWMFSESLPYLRQLGAVDESDQAHPSILIPNYMNSAANSLGKSQFFELACIDECQELLGHFERRLGAPTASAAKIAAVALHLPSSSHAQVPAIPDDLLSKLQDVAAAHGGQVPLHGRLFAQWLHHMYPRDCPYPHAAGTTRQELADDFENRTGISSNETVESMRKIISSFEVSTSTALPWDMEEELLDPPRAASRKGLPMLPLLAAAVAAVLLSLAAIAGRALRSRVGGPVGQGPLLDVHGACDAQPVAAVQAATPVESATV